MAAVTANDPLRVDLEWPKDGLAITLSLSFNFRLKPCIRSRQCPGELAQLYLQIGGWEEIKAAYGRISRNSLRTVAAKYYAFDYFSEQGDQLKAEMQNTLNRDLGMWKAGVDSFQLTRINLGKEFEEARAEQEAALQEQLSVVQSKKNNVTHWVGVIKRVNETAQLIMKAAEAKRHQIQVNAAAAAASLKARVNVEADSFRRARGTLNFTSKELLAWVWLDAMKATAAASTVIDVETPELISTAGY